MSRVARYMGWLVCVFFVLVGAVLAADSIPERDPVWSLAKGSAQAILATCLLGVTAALCLCGRLLIGAYLAQIRDLKQTSEQRDAQTNLVVAALTDNANALRELRKHCEKFGLLILAAGVLLCGCVSRPHVRYPIEEMRDPVTEEVPDVILPHT